MQIIIVGCGKVGETLAKQLNKENHDVVIIDTNAEKIQNVCNQIDALGVCGNGASHVTLGEAGIKNTDLLIAVTGSDELNILCCLIARKAGKCQTIARVRNYLFSEEVNFIKEELGLSMVINPEQAAATEIARLLRIPSAIEIDTFAKGRVEILKFKVENNSKLHNLSVMDISTKLKSDVLVCAVERGEKVIIPNGGFILQAGDMISIVASPQNASKFFSKITLANNQVKDVMIVGGGEITYYLAKQLLSMGIKVKIIERSKNRSEKLSELLPKALIINGDGTDQNILDEEGIEKIESFVSLTNIDEENIILSLFARSKTKGKVITKINRVNYGEVIDNLNLGSIISPKNITSEYILQYVRAMQNSLESNIETLYNIIEDKAEALEFYIREKSSIVGVPLEKLNLKKNILISCINHNGKIIFPGGQDIISVGDTVIVVTTNTGYKDISDILEK